MFLTVDRLMRPAIGPGAGVTVHALCLALSLGGQAKANELDRVVFGSLDGAASGFATAGAKLAEKGTGPALMANGSLGGVSYPSTSITGARVTLHRSVAIAALVFGYQWYGEDGVVGAFAGPEGTIAAVSGEGGLSSQTVSPGLRLQGEVWLRPVADTLLQSTLVAGTTRRSLWTRFAGGLRVDESYIGPEIAFYTEATGYRKWSFGLHVTDFTLTDVHFRVSAGGQVLSPEQRIGPYVGLAAWRDW